MKQIFLLILIILSTSCRMYLKPAYSKELKKCINTSCKNSENTPLTIDYYDFMRKIEKLYIDKGLLKDTKKKSYEQLFNNLENTDISDIYKKQKEIEKKYLFYSSGYAFIQRVFKTCAMKSEKKIYGKLNSKTKQQIYLFNQIEAKGYNDKESRLNYLNSFSKKEFKNIVYRANLIYLTMLGINEFNRKKSSN